jgi:hypothetical protein
MRKICFLFICASFTPSMNTFRLHCLKSRLHVMRQGRSFCDNRANRPVALTSKDDHKKTGKIFLNVNAVLKRNVWAQARV